MSVESLLTLRIVSNNEQAGQTSYSAKEQTEGAPEGSDIFDVFLAQVNLANEAASGLLQTSQLTNANPTAGEAGTPVDLTQFLANNGALLEGLEGDNDLADTDLTQIIALNQSAFEEIFQSLQQDASLSFTPKFLNAGQGVSEINLSSIYQLNNTNPDFSNYIKAIMENLQQLSNSSEPQLIVTNLTPDDLAALQTFADQLAPLQAENTPITENYFEGTNRAQNVLSVLVNLTQAQAQTQSNNASLSGPHATSSEHTQNAQNLVTAALNSSAATQTQNGTQNSAPNTNPFDARADNPFTTDIDARALNDIEPQAGQTKTPGKATVKPDGAMPGSAPNATLNTVTQERMSMIDLMQMSQGIGGGSLPWSTEGDGIMFSDIANLAPGQALVHSLNAHTSLSMQAATAAHPHPATHMVAAQLNKTAGKGQDSQISIQLDPPDLGRIDIDMRFAKDKGVKTIMTIEKPETLGMLQRDVHALERALQDAGLEIGSDSLSFDLAGEGYDFNHNGGHDDQGPRGKAADAGDEVIQDLIIETTMDWHVDPETGHTHYDLWA